MKKRSQLYLLDCVLAKLSDAEFDKYRNSFSKGSLEADWPNYHIGNMQTGFTAFTHFYHPDRKTLFPHAKQIGIWKFDKALRLYPKAKRNAFFCLGKAFHLLTGLAVPAHSKFIYHLFDTDDLEVYLDSYVKDSPKVRIRRVAGSLPELFDSIARKSSRLECLPNNMWRSIWYVLSGRKRKLSEPVLKRQARIVLDLAASYGYSMCLRFKDNV